MKDKHLKRLLLSPVVIMAVAAITGSAGAATLQYDLNFNDQTLTNSGAAGGVATSTATTAPDLTFTSSTPDGSAYALSFPSTSSFPRGEYITLPNSTSLFSLASAGDQMTIDTWIKWDGVSNSITLFGIAEKNGVNGWIFSLNSSGNLVFNYKLSSGVSATRTSTAVITAGVWVNIALVWDSSSGQSVTGYGLTQNLKFYINGVDAGLNSGQAAANATLLGSSASIVAGDYNSNGNNPLNGSIDNFQIYDYALTSTQIAALATPVPEPATASLLIGLTVLAGVAFRRKRH